MAHALLPLNQLYILYSNRAYIRNTSARGEDSRKTERNQMKGRRSGMKIMSNECMVSVLKTR